MDCDFDESGDVTGPDEEICRDECQVSNLCTELSGFEERDQFSADVNGYPVWISNSAQVSNFDAFEGCVLIEETPPTYDCPKRLLHSATGNLRHVFLTSQIQIWELLPRYSCDLIFDCQSNEDCPDNQLCLENQCN
jgi:hypothetical protein